MTFTAEFAAAGSAVETLENGERGIYATGRTLHVENGRGILPGVHRRRPVGLYGQRQQRDTICPRYVYRAHERPLAESGGKITIPVLPFFRQGGGGISAAFSLTPYSRSIYHLFLF